MSRVTSLALILALGISLTTTAQANPLAKPKSAEARKHLKVGNKLLELRKYDLAIKSYNDGYLIEGATIFLYNLGLASRKKGDLKAAIDYYRNFLNRARNARPNVLKAIRKIVDEMRVELEKQTREKAKPKPDNPPPREKPDIVNRTEPPARSAAWYSDKLGWAISGAGLMVTGIGVGLLANASSLDSDAAKEPDFMKRDELRNSADTRRTWGTVLGIAGAAGLAAGIVKLVLHTEKPAGGKPGATVVFGPTHIALRGIF